MNNAMKMIRLALSAMLVSTLVTACAVGTDSEPSTQEEQADQPEITTQSTGVITETTYYNNAAHTTVVGGCLFSSCPPKGKQCWGQKTVYTEVVSEACFY